MKKKFIVEVVLFSNLYTFYMKKLYSKYCQRYDFRHAL